MATYVFPGQGSQHKGMGRDLFDRYPDLTAIADRVLGYSIKELCLNDPGGVLGETKFTQPALFVVNALTYLQMLDAVAIRPNYVAGHSLGEYNALFAADVFDLETGLRLVRKRGELMAKVKGGGMAAVVGLPEDVVVRVLADNGFTTIDIANRNTPSQYVISGPVDDIQRTKPAFESAGAKLFAPLRVSAPFHSRHMEGVRREFDDFAATMQFRPPMIPVVSNVHARPYPNDRIREILAEQITSSVRWTETIQYLIAVGERDFRELGPGTVLGGLIKKIQAEAAPLQLAEATHASSSPSSPSGRIIRPTSRPSPSSRAAISAESLGNPEFKAQYGLRYAYVAGSMYKGIASRELVVRMAKARLLAFLGTGGLTAERIAEDLRFIRRELSDGQTFGANLLSNPLHPAVEDETVQVLLRNGVRLVEAAAYTQMTPSLVRYRLHGIHKGDRGQVIAPNNVLAKASRPEIAEAFMSPPPSQIVEKLLRAGAISGSEAELSRFIPMACDVCVECDSGGHTDQGIATVLIPAMLNLRDRVMERYRYPASLRVGMAGGIGAPEAAAAAFILGADFILTGSINQCTVEAGISDAVKDMLQDMDVQHTEYAPAGDMFELGARVQVLRKGVLFPARANKLYDLYLHHNSLDEIDEETKKQIQERYFRKTFDEVWRETREYYARVKPDEIERAERSPKHKMGMVFRWYFIHTLRIAMEGDPDCKVDYQVHCGPAMGAFNRWVKGSALENWRQRHVDELGERLMTAAAEILGQRFQQMTAAGMD